MIHFSLTHSLGYIGIVIVLFFVFFLTFVVIIIVIVIISAFASDRVRWRLVAINVVALNGLEQLGTERLLRRVGRKLQLKVTCWMMTIKRSENDLQRVWWLVRVIDDIVHVRDSGNDSSGSGLGSG